MLNHDKNVLLGILKLVLTKLAYVIIFIPLLMTGFDFISYYILFPLVILLPNGVLNKYLLFLWGGNNIPNGKSIEPAMLNFKEEQERDLEM